MTLQKMPCMYTKNLMRDLYLTVLMGGLLLSPCYADEIIFKDEGVQTGTVLEEDERSVIIRFPKESVQSIIRSQEKISSTEKTQYLEPATPAELRFQEQLEQFQERIERLEKGLENGKKAGSLPVTDISKKVSHKQLLQEEMGRVEGIILWKKKPLVNGSVMIVLERYTGFSLASLKKMFSGDKGKSSDQITLETKTDSQGRYVFEKVPPGEFRLYWMPDAETGWIRRMREKPDFEVMTGELTIQNIPREKK